MKDFALQYIEDIDVKVASIPGINALQLDYVSSIGGVNAPEAGADVTAENIALAIAGQGSLATKSSVTATEIADRAISTVKIALEAVTAEIVAAGAITENKLYTGAVTADKIAANTITAAKIAANTITAGEIAAYTITAAKMNVAQLSAIAADLGSITAGTITGALLQTSASTYSGIKISSDLGGMVIYGQTLQLRDTSNTLYGYIGGYSGYYNIGTSSNRNILMSTGSGSVYVSAASIAPLSSGVGSCGLSSSYWSDVYTNNLTLSSGKYLHYTGGYIQSESQFRVVGSIALTGNMTFENYSSLTIKDSGGTSRSLTVKYNAILGLYILST